MGNKELKRSGEIYALRCTPELSNYSFPCTAVSRLAEEGIDGACEDDLPAAATMVVLRGSSGRIPCVLDIDSADFQRNLLRLWHCGQLALSLGNSSKASGVTPEWGSRKGVVLPRWLNPGKVTIAKISRKGDKILITLGMIVDHTNHMLEVM